MSQPSVEELLGHHYKYEVEMLRDVYLKISQAGDVTCQNALKESFCIHARALLEFFEKSRGAKSHATNYVPFLGVASEKLKTWQQRMNNQVAHLLDGRTSEQDEKIDDDERTEIFQVLRDETVRFKQALEADHPSIEVPELPLTIKVGQGGPTNDIGQL